MHRRRALRLRGHPSRRGLPRRGARALRICGYRGNARVELHPADAARVRRHPLASRSAATWRSTRGSGRRIARSWKLHAARGAGACCNPSLRCLRCNGRRSSARWHDGNARRRELDCGSVRIGCDPCLHRGGGTRGRGTRLCRRPIGGFGDCHHHRRKQSECDRQRARGGGAHLPAAGQTRVHRDSHGFPGMQPKSWPENSRLARLCRRNPSDRRRHADPNGVTCALHVFGEEHARSSRPVPKHARPMHEPSRACRR